VRKKSPPELAVRSSLQVAPAWQPGGTQAPLTPRSMHHRPHTSISMAGLHPSRTHLRQVDERGAAGRQRAADRGCHPLGHQIAQRHRPHQTHRDALCGEKGVTDRCHMLSNE